MDRDWTFVFWSPVTERKRGGDLNMHQIFLYIYYYSDYSQKEREREEKTNSTEKKEEKETAISAGLCDGRSTRQ